ncbi:hypothetical protein OV207_16485 [Corallococcus sp. BB11-1]|uniref:hypothetical protein n=1 Tax=Corallococcus sp. BB11-1 TaxID=2996783 RepID=UPI00226EAFC4|nr:hypothetical protein [Corallococcus sp. BB11-1]MCY1033071.1 hypothetical protein [Corallococcus sp. BB11-1]
MLGALGLSVSALACAALVVVLDFAWSGPTDSNSSQDLLVPPPMYGLLPSFELRDEQGRPLGSRQLHGRLTLVQFSSNPDARRLDFLRRIQERLKAMEIPVQVVIVMSPASPAAERQAMPQGWWRVWDGDGLTAATRELGQKALPDDAESRGRPWNAVVLVDQLGGMRGVYGPGRDEQTAERLVEDTRCLRACGPFSVPPS